MTGARVEIARFPDETTAQLVVSRLRAEGIEAVLLADDAGSTYPMLQMVHGVRVLVAEEDEEAAMEMLEAVEEYEVAEDEGEG